ncbi:hypothetical protein Pint_15764 [Pistacia integerrima]|uniref:Uncharacterized protein n=1 Tax=Pistacia integerrima TaxID=434235 RepID=A0ACC0ZAJ9_9ROSI|nr:hypothetical protein Pint_15764 [Pistacia integerrima]
MNEKLMNCAEHGDVETLYSILGEDPYVLERLDQIPIVDTPIHRATSSGNTHLALEIASLKPSLAWKLNHLGFSPLHLALEHGNDQLVRGFIKTESELVRVKAKERITPLHYVAQTNNADLLAEFLTVCPSSIHDVTIRCETTVHLAIKNKNVDAFRVLLGFLRRNNMEDILNFTDEDGNTALHIATSTNQPEGYGGYAVALADVGRDMVLADEIGNESQPCRSPVEGREARPRCASIVKYLLRTGVNVSTRNLSGLTAMEISCSEEDSLKKKTERLLRRAKAVSGFAHDAADSNATLARKMGRDLSFTEEREKYLGIMGKSLKLSPSDVRNVILVVAILIATAAYQAGLSPPGGAWQDEYSPTTNNRATNDQNNTIGKGHGKKGHHAGEMIMNPIFLTIFFVLNSLAFYTSVCTIVIVVIGLPYSPILCTSTCCLLLAYYVSVATTFPGEVTQGLNLVLLIIFGISIILVLWLPLQAIRRALKLKGLVRFLRSHRQICGIDY